MSDVKPKKNIAPVVVLVIALMSLAYLLSYFYLKIESLADAYNSDTRIVAFDWVDINNPYQYGSEQEAEAGYQRAEELFKHFKDKNYLILDAKAVDAVPSEILINSEDIKQSLQASK